MSKNWKHILCNIKFQTCGCSWAQHISCCLCAQPSAILRPTAFGTRLLIHLARAGLSSSYLRSSINHSINVCGWMLCWEGANIHHQQGRPSPGGAGWGSIQIIKCNHKCCCFFMAAIDCVWIIYYGAGVRSAWGEISCRHAQHALIAAGYPLCIHRTELSSCGAANGTVWRHYPKCSACSVFLADALPWSST